MISKPISSPAGSSVASVSVGNATPSILAVGVGVLVEVLVEVFVCSGHRFYFSLRIVVQDWSCKL